MNYGGTYRNTPKNLVAQAAAENLSIVEDLIVNKEQRIPDIAYFSTYDGGCAILHRRIPLFCFMARNSTPAIGGISACST
jgi:hypothetical protein